MKVTHLLALTFLLFFSFASCTSVTQAQTIDSYLANLGIFVLWVFSDFTCLTLGWGGILFANDAGAVYNQCQLSFIDWYTMEA